MDVQTLTALIDRHTGALVLYARQWCAAPEDVVQEAFMQLVRQQPPPHHPVAWLYRVVRNAARLQARSARRRLQREAKVARPELTWFDPPDEAGGLDPQAVTAALAGLPLDQREVIVARLWGNLTFDEIAQLTGLSKATAHRRYEAALAALRARLGVTCPPTT
jgi:RNA polymerase sigma-70 factor (ECF subfamily)